MSEPEKKPPLWPVLLCQAALAGVSVQAWYDHLPGLATVGAFGWCVAWVGFIAVRRGR